MPSEVEAGGEGNAVGVGAVRKCLRAAEGVLRRGGAHASYTMPDGMRCLQPRNQKRNASVPSSMVCCRVERRVVEEYVKVALGGVK